VGSPDGKRPLGRPRCKWEGIQVDLKELCWEGVDLKDVAQDRDKCRVVVKSVMNFRVS
jgi:hypothetical protein